MSIFLTEIHKDSNAHGLSNVITQSHHRPTAKRAFVLKQIYYYFFYRKWQIVSIYKTLIPRVGSCRALWSWNLDLQPNLSPWYLSTLLSGLFVGQNGWFCVMIGRIACQSNSWRRENSMKHCEEHNHVHLCQVVQIRLVSMALLDSTSRIHTMWAKASLYSAGH